MQGRRIKAAGIAEARKAKEQEALSEFSIPDAGVSRNGKDAENLSIQGIRLSFLIHDVSRMRRAAYDKFMKPIDITRGQWWVLSQLSRQDGMMQTQLAALLDVGKASLGHIVGSLEHDGWIVRRPDPADERARRVYLSRSGHALIKQTTSLETRFNNRIFADISPAGREHLISELLKIKKAISRLER